MENLHCDIVTDLLPLYVDGVASEESQKAVEAHLEGCEKCREQLAVLQKTVPAPVDVDTAPIKKVKREIQKKKYIGIAIGALLALTVVVLALARFTSPVLLPLDQAKVVVEERDGELFLTTTSPYVMGWDVEQSGGTVFVTCWETEWAHFRHSARNQRMQELSKPVELDGGIQVYTMFSTPEEEVYQEKSLRKELGDSDAVEQVYYYSADEESILLYSKGEVNEGVQLLEKLTLNYYALIACGGAVVCGAAWLVLRKKKIGRGFGYAALLFVSYVAGHTAVMSGRNCYFLIRDLSGILLVTLPLWGALVFACKAIGRRMENVRNKKGNV